MNLLLSTNIFFYIAHDIPAKKLIQTQQKKIGKQSNLYWLFLPEAILIHSLMKKQINKSPLTHTHTILHYISSAQLMLQLTSTAE